MKRAIAKLIVFRVTTALLVFSSLATGLRAQITEDPKRASYAAGMKEYEAAGQLATRSDEASLSAAIERLVVSVELFEKAENPSAKAASLTLRGVCKERLRRYDDALADFENALAVFTAGGLPSSQATVLNLIGNTYLKKKEPTKARDVLERAWQIVQTNPFQSLDLLILNNLGNAYIALSDRTRATDALWKAVQIGKDRTPTEALFTLKNYADAQVELETPQFAVPYYESALTRARELKLTDTEAQILTSIGELYVHRLGEPEKAKPYLDQALAKAESLGNQSMRCLALYDLGYYSYLTIRMDDALAYYERARVIAVKIGNRSYQANIANNIGLVHWFFEDYAKAIPYFEQTIAIARELGDLSIEAHALVNHAKACGRNGDSETAVADFARAAELAKTGFPGIQQFRIGALLEFGNFAFRSGDTKKALELFSTALDSSAALGGAGREPTLVNNIAKIHELSGDLVKALELYNQALSISRSLGLREPEAKVLENLMGIWTKLGNKNIAVFYGKTSINIYQGFRKGLAGVSIEDQRSFVRTVEFTYRKLAELLIEQGRIAEAEQVLTMLKEEELIDYVRRDDQIAKAMLATIALTNDERAALSRYELVAGQITAIGKEFDELDRERLAYPAGQFPKQKRYDELKQQLADAKVTFEKFLDELKLKFGRRDERVTQVDSSLKGTLERLKADQTAVVSTIVGEDTLNIIVTTSRTQRAHSIKKSAAEINQLVGKMRQGLTSPQYDPRPVAQQLYDILVKPIESDLNGIKANTIVWSLDGTLRYIPPAALWDKQKGYLVERFSNVIINLASRDTLALPVPKGQALAALGVGVSRPVESFAPLAAVPDELDCIVSDKTAGLLSRSPQCQKGVLNGRKLLDESFTLSNFENELGRYPIVHIASHFKLTPGDDKNSFLLLGGGDDRKFTVEKLRSEPLTGVELIVLSACNTATPGGARTNGVEIEGFGSIAQKEGAKAVMATLWSVADTSTKDFMVEFYELYGNAGSSKADAMRQAQLKLLNGKNSTARADDKPRADSFAQAGSSLPPFKADPNAPFAHPYYWSPFILIGNWR